MASGNIVEEYVKACPGSKKLHERAEKIFAANGATHLSRLMDPFRPYITHAKGSHKWDVDGNEYIDYVTGHGALILGHAHPAIVKAVQEQVAKGTHYGENHELEIQWAELIQKMVPSQQRVEFFSCGQEANMMAIRVARAYTGRKRVLRFFENFHGWSDELVIPTFGVCNDYVKVIPMNDLSIVEKELATKEYAIMFVEGGGAHMGGQIPWETDFVRALPDMAKKYGTVLLVDEVVTGFRDAVGGWEELVGITPDLSSWGKVIAGGLGCGALGGKAEIMDMLKPKPAPQKYLTHTGTWNANPLTSAAGVAACKLFHDGNVQKKANELGAYLRKKGNEVFKRLGVNGRLYGRSIVHVYFGSIDFEPSNDELPPTKDPNKLMGGNVEKNRLHIHLMHRGIATMSARLFIFSCVHTEKDVDQTVKALSDSFEAMLAEGTLKKA